jgi:hypothetical protein
MKTARLAALAVAIAVNALALGALHLAMVQGEEQAELARAEPERINVTAEPLPSDLAHNHCSGTSSL